jgi:manganese-dependent inorganic pyrophosphatase
MTEKEETDVKKENPAAAAEETEEKVRPVYVVGHMNPDTDSICSAIAYAKLKEKLTGNPYYPKRAGQLNLETQYVLQRFGFPQPFFISDVRRQVKDMDIRRFKRVLSCLSLKKAWEWMADMNVVTLPIVDEEGYLTGIITEGDIAESYMGMYDSKVVSQAGTSYKNLVETLGGELVVGDKDHELTEGKVLIAAANPDTMEEFIDDGDIVITGNRYESQLCAIEMNAACVIVTGGSKVSRTITKLAQEKNCSIIETPYDTFTAARLINQSIPIDFYMKKDNLITFHPNDFIDDVKDTMTKYRHRDFPVVDKDGKLLGMISRRKLLGAKKKQVILVDHNERSQAVDGIEDAEILEIIDHHRLGSLETINPVFFRNQPLGCTATIVYQMYRENQVEVEPGIAGLLCSAILSDTLVYRSPTCTPMDRQAAEELAAIAGISVEEHAQAMFAAGSNFGSRTAEEIFYQDYKKFNVGERTLGIGQVNMMSRKEMEELEVRLLPYMSKVLKEKAVDMVFFMLTNIMDESTLLLCQGEGAAEVAAGAFHQEPQESMFLPGVVSRKKQVVPSIMSAMQNENI